MTPPSLQHWIEAGETQTQEFKSSFDKACIETLVAFANAKGGRVLVGVTDQGALQGVTLLIRPDEVETVHPEPAEALNSDHPEPVEGQAQPERKSKLHWAGSIGKESLNEWLVQIKAATSPSIIPELEAHQVNGKTLVVISVAEFPVKPVSTKGRYYKRTANTNQALNANEISDLYMQSLQLSWDAYPAHNAQLSDLSMAKVDKFVQQVNAGGRFALGTTDSLTALHKLNYISQGKPTWAAMLLFAQEPLRHHIHIGRFKTPSLIIDDRQITDTLFEAVDQALRFIVSYVPVAFEITGAVHRKERFAYPLPALREALLNAVVHRDYKDGSDIQVKILDHQISIFSPGRLYDGLTLAELQHDHYRSRLRNKLVAEGFYLTTAIEKYGSGFIRMRQALTDYPEIELRIEEISGGLSVSFTRTDGTPDSTEAHEGVSEGVSEGVNRLLLLIQQQPGLRTPSLASQLNTSVKNVERWLQQLKDQQRIEFRGAPKTGGYHPKS